MWNKCFLCSVVHVWSDFRPFNCDAAAPPSGHEWKHSAGLQLRLCSIRWASFLHENQMRVKNRSTEFNHCESFSIPVLLEQCVCCERQSLSVLGCMHVVQFCDHVMTAESTKQTKCLEFLHDRHYVLCIWWCKSLFSQIKWSKTPCRNASNNFFYCS